MDTLFDTYEIEGNEKISLESLYDKQKEIDNMRMAVYQKVLQRIHKRIEYTSKAKHNEQFVFYIFPEYMVGVPRYNVNHCIIYCINRLEKNGFVTKYTHPNVLFISWKHYIPSYKRDAIKKKYGMDIDGFGKQIKEIPKLTKQSESANEKEKEKKKDSLFRDIKSYKPQGIYKNVY